MIWQAPTLVTERLTLRPYEMADFEAYAGFVVSDRTRFMGGPHDRATAWNWFASDVAQWQLIGLGGLAVVERESGRFLGEVNVIRPPSFPETELGWFLMPEAEGKGYMTEAATAMRDWAFGPRGLPTLVSYIDPANARSIALAIRLGAVLDPDAPTPNNDPTAVYRLTPHSVR